MKTILKTISVLFLTVALLFGCGKEQEPINTEFNNSKVTIDYKFYNNEREVTRAYREWMGKEITNDPFGDAEREGFAHWDSYAKTCTVHTLKIRHVEDEKRLAILGHEVLHCVYGRYHK